MQKAKRKIKLALWKKLIRELKKRGEGRRETGAFLLGSPTGNIITDFICYNDLDSKAFDSGIIIFNGDGYIPLWQYCAEKKLKVLADVHTHPGGWTGQSASDQKHPMVAQKGHIALIVPHFATKRNQLLKNVGVHEFLGNKKWIAWNEEDGIIEILK